MKSVEKHLLKLDCQLQEECYVGLDTMVLKLVTFWG